MTFQSFGPCKLRSWTINNWQGAGAVHHGKSQLLRPWHSAFRAFSGFASHDRNVLLVEIPQNSPSDSRVSSCSFKTYLNTLKMICMVSFHREPPCIAKPVVEEGSHVEPIPFASVTSTERLVTISDSMCMYKVFRLKASGRGKFFQFFVYIRVLRNAQSYLFPHSHPSNVSCGVITLCNLTMMWT